MDFPRRSLTPVAPVPPGSRENGGASVELCAPISIVTPSGQWDHEQGELLIGRGTSCQIVIDDPLVSEVHARLVVVADDRVLVEDLNSTNGLYINGIKLTRPSSGLRDGDRLLLGTTEISVFATRASAKIPLRRRIAAIDLNPSGAFKIAPPTPATKRADAEGPEGSPAVTLRADAFAILGRLADRMTASGRADQAARVLAEHLRNMLLGAAAGLPVPTATLDRATVYALRLYDSTQSASWIDYTFELHVACREVPSHTTLDAIEGVYSTAEGTDPTLISYLVQVLHSRPSGVRQDEEERVLRLSQLVSDAKPSPSEKQG